MSWYFDNLGIPKDEGFMLSRGLELIAKEVEGLKAKVSDLEQGVK